MVVAKFGFCDMDNTPISVGSGEESFKPDYIKYIFLGMILLIIVGMMGKSQTDDFTLEHKEWESKSRPLATGGNPRWKPVSPSGIPEQTNVAEGLSKNEQPRLVYSFPYDDVAISQNIVLNESTGQPLIKDTKTRYAFHHSRNGLNSQMRHPPHAVSTAARRISETKVEQHEKFTEERASPRIDRNLNHYA